MLIYKKNIEFAKYYNVTKYFNSLVNEGKIIGVNKTYENGYFVCQDTNDFHICRIQVGINSEYEPEPKTKIVELYDISKEDFNDFVLNRGLLFSSEVISVCSPLKGMRKVKETSSNIIKNLSLEQIVAKIENM